MIFIEKLLGQRAPKSVACCNKRAIFFVFYLVKLFNIKRLQRSFDEFVFVFIECLKSYSRAKTAQEPTQESTQRNGIILQMLCVAQRIFCSIREHHIKLVLD